MQNNEIKKIIIAGGGTAGWLAAALFATHIPKERLEVILIESEEIGTIGVGEYSLALSAILVLMSRILFKNAMQASN